MSLGLFGAHRVGKSTLAQAYAEAENCPFVETTTSQVFHRLGFDPSEPMTFAQRLFVQNEILKEAVSQWSEYKGFFVTDRTPIDYMMYTLADIDGETAPEYENELREYMEACFHATNLYFSTLILVQPGIPLVHEEGKAALNPLYIEHCNSLARGLAYDERCTVPTFYIKRSYLDLSVRVKASQAAVKSVQSRMTQKVAEVLH